ncbi:MAG TPA: hypothetical protein DCS91_00560 [Microcoleaceae bacterium UBA11344]|nr:hypothetical protein [Microcoleaceae cyanobacterium UBA11344]
MARNRVFARYFVTARDSGKNPVSLMHGWPETGFLRAPSLQPADSGKNPVSLDFNRRFPANA